MTHPIRPIADSEVVLLRSAFVEHLGFLPDRHLTEVRSELLRLVEEGLIADEDILGATIFIASLLVPHIPNRPIDDLAYARQQAVAVLLFHDDALGEFVRIGWLPRLTPINAAAIDYCSRAFRRWGRDHKPICDHLHKDFVHAGRVKFGKVIFSITDSLRSVKEQLTQGKKNTEDNIKDVLHYLEMLPPEKRPLFMRSDKHGMATFDGRFLRRAIQRGMAVDVGIECKRPDVSTPRTVLGATDDLADEMADMLEVRDMQADMVDVQLIRRRIGDQATKPTNSKCVQAVRNNLRDLLEGRLQISELSRTTGLHPTGLNRALRAEKELLRRQLSSSPQEDPRSL